MADKKSDRHLVARMAGNIAAGLISRGAYDGQMMTLASRSVELARAILAEVDRTEPNPSIGSQE